MYQNGFKGVEPKPKAMPNDVKRLIEHGRFTYYKRLYFYSPTTNKIYRYYPREGYAYDLTLMKKGKNSFVATLIPDADDGTGTNPVRDSVYISPQFMKRIETMESLVIPMRRRRQ